MAISIEDIRGEHEGEVEEIETLVIGAGPVSFREGSAEIRPVSELLSV